VGAGVGDGVGVGVGDGVGDGVGLATHTDCPVRPLVKCVGAHGAQATLPSSEAA
jgi:hypothetical protein